MAQQVGYFANHVLLTEGPFVIVNVHGWRIEVDRVCARCPGLTSLAVQDLARRAHGFPGKVASYTQAEIVCDHLNQLVRAGLIVYDEATDAWDPIPDWATAGAQLTAPSWAAFQQRMNAVAASRGVPAPF
ncbi:MAG: hypothetical protein IPJ61_19360 [Tessaracoccus sp.]|jgi:hypothetical protein|uniref:hypothetical protein n=1 Tax=Tessaracoccus sp. TaxID=1971211 RepID=UPI001EC7575A|nr:hypothetical protein [Tessaracoccus sp.]MBK7823146.1 hypothetical protein [Tessaracoccus sp.]